MRSYSNLLANGLRSRGHSVIEATAPTVFSGFVQCKGVLGKWLGYIDQYLLFPPFLFILALFQPKDTLCVLCDQVLSPWLQWIAGRPSVVHCHDFLALQGAQGFQPFHRLGLTGRAYQIWIRSGFRKARCFLSVSEATRLALHQQLKTQPLLSAVLYNPLSPRFAIIDKRQAAATVEEVVPELAGNSFLLHIGRNWYKNRLGVLAIWEQLLLLGSEHHLVLVGDLEPELYTWLRLRPHLNPRLHVLSYASNELIVALYNVASALVFPSHAEGFGWPVIEGLACGCPVMTTDRAPMTEVGGEAVTIIPPTPTQSELFADWAASAALALATLLQRSPLEQDRIRQLGILQAGRFNIDLWLDQLEQHYHQALALQQSKSILT